jgi:uncharacterized protein DUF4037
MPGSDIQQALAQIVATVADLPGFAAITLGGSIASGLADDRSDLDLHVYWREPLAAPALRAERLARVADAGSVAVDILTWGREDHLRVQGWPAELIYVPLAEIRSKIDRAYGEGLISEGYTTARLFYIANGRLLHDPSGDLGALQARLLAEYPEPTRRLLLRHQPELLHYYLELLGIAQVRGDLLFVQHCRTSFQEVFFNLLFALNRCYHPGEKRLLIHGEGCPLRPAGLGDRWQHATRLPADDPSLAGVLGSLAADLCRLIEADQ